MILAVHIHCLVLHETLIDPLWNTSTHGSEIIKEPMKVTKHMPSRMSNSDSPVIVHHGCHSIYNCCASEQRENIDCLAIAISGGVNLVIKCMNSFPE